MASNYGFRDHEVNEIGRLVDENRELFLEAWNVYFNIDYYGNRASIRSNICFGEIG